MTANAYPKVFEGIDPLQRYIVDRIVIQQGRSLIGNTKHFAFGLVKMELPSVRPVVNPGKVIMELYAIFSTFDVPEQGAIISKHPSW